MSDPSSSTSASAPKRSLSRQTVLEEDEYTAALSHIIARDFFPSLVHLDATNEYLDALESRDLQLIGASVRNLESINASVRSARPWRTPSETPYGVGPSDTPTARYTSEDNASFTQILDEENVRRREKYGWAWDAQRRVEAQRVKALEVRERALIEMPESAWGERADEDRGARPGWADHRSVVRKKNEAMRARAGRRVATTPNPLSVRRSFSARRIWDDIVEDVMAPKKDTRPAGVDGWAFRARNSLMFSPGADVSPYDPSSSSAKNTAKGPPKTIKHGNTRLPEQDDTLSSSRAASEPPSPTQSRVDNAIAGTTYRPKSPGVSNFSYVPSLPSPTPSELGPAAVKQLMTWGTLAGTPRILSQPDDPAEESIPVPTTPFHISAPTKREMLSHKLSSSAAKSLRAKVNLMGAGSTRGRKGDMAPPSWTPRRAEASGSLTPAGKRLLDRTTMGTAASRRADAMGKTAGWEKDKDLNRVRWTPTPSPVTRR
ncbi:nuclear protein DGCR14 [Lactarius akahatsu]|uniref:Nuclear protein DGCR14 n=1 Tax=Lactarius akahatsu TaxID=416441 RepID=A0AAD4Q6W8_9AGAM|nr:nuclear protein DGCR14 [Lactarius akahatsu]